MKSKIKIIFAVFVMVISLMVAVSVSAQHSDAHLDVKLWSGEYAGKYSIGVELSNISDSPVVVAAQYIGDVLEKVELKNCATSQCKFFVHSSVQSVDIIVLENTKNLRPLTQKLTVACNPDCEVRYETLLVVSPYTKSGYTVLRDRIDMTKEYPFINDEVDVTKISSLGEEPHKILLNGIVGSDVVSIAQPLDENAKIAVKVSGITVSGEVGNVDYENNTIIVDSIEYSFSEYYKYLLSVDPELYGCDVGDNVKIYLDYFGRVVYIDIIPLPYGYLIDWHENDGYIAVRFLDDKGQLVTYDLKSKVKVNGIAFNTDIAITLLEASSARIHANKAVGYGAFPAENPGNSPVSQVIRYKMGTEDGKTVVEELFTVGPEPVPSYESETGAIIPHWTETDGTNAPFISCYNKLTCSGSSTTKMFRNSYGSIEFSVNNKTVVFKIPGGPGVEKDAEKYKRSIGSYSFSDKTSYYVEAYDVDVTTAQVVVYYLTGSSDKKIYANTSTYMVVNITTTANNGKTVHELEYVKLGENIYDPADGVTKVTKKVFSKDAYQLAGLKKGDVIKFVTSSGEIEKVEKLFIFDEKQLYGKDGDDGTVSPETDNYFAHKKGYDTEYYQARYGKVYDLTVDETGKGSIAIYTDGSQDNYDQIYSLTANTKYYTIDDRGNVVDTGYGAIAEGSRSDYASASNVLVVSYDEKVVGVYVMPQE